MSKVWRRSRRSRSTLRRWKVEGGASVLSRRMRRGRRVRSRRAVRRDDGRRRDIRGRRRRRK